MFDFPKNLEIGHQLSRLMDGWVDWIVINFDPLFRAINAGVLALLVPLEKFLMGEPLSYGWPQWLSMPWWLVIGVTVYIAWRTAGRNIAILTTVLFLLMATLGLFDFAMQTLAITFTATLIAIAIGLPLGIFGAKSAKMDAISRPILDAMQTMPSFVYLVPAIMLFGLGKTPAVMATVIYAIPPLIRLTNLGIRQVDREVVEAAIAFGSTSRQLLTKVQLPMAMPTIMAGINQCIMMALAMVVICSMIGAKGLGIEVMNGIARLEVGRGFLGGLGIVMMAIMIDRITQSVGKSRSSQIT